MIIKKPGDRKKEIKRMAKKSKKEIKKVAGIVAGVLAVVLVAGLFTTLFVKLDRQTTTTRIGCEAYSIGTLDDTGEPTETNTAIYMRKSITTDGLKCELAEDAKIKYELFFYDKDGEFVSSTGDLTADWAGEIPVGAESVKVMITPTEDEDGKVSIVEVLGYADQLTVTVNK